MCRDPRLEATGNDYDTGISDSHITDDPGGVEVQEATQ